MTGHLTPQTAGAEQQQNQSKEKTSQTPKHNTMMDYRHFSPAATVDHFITIQSCCRSRQEERSSTWGRAAAQFTTADPVLTQEVGS